MSVDGAEHLIDAAVEAVEHHIEQLRQSSHLRWSNHLPSERDLEEHLLIDPELIGPFIGKGGANMKKLESSCGCKSVFAEGQWC